MRKRLKVRSREEAERLILLFLRDLMAFGPQVVIRLRGGDYDWHDCTFRGRKVSISRNEEIRIAGFPLTEEIRSEVGTRLRTWTTALLRARAEEARKRTERAYTERLCRLAEDLHGAGAYGE